MAKQTNKQNKMKNKQTYVFSDYINRNITLKLIGRNSPTRPCPIQMYGLVQCFANRHHAKITCHTNERIHYRILR